MGDLSSIPPSKVTDTDTLLSKFIFVDTMSPTDLGQFGGNTHALKAISDSYDGAKFLWEPRGYYDCRGESLPGYAEDPKSEMVSADELLEKAERAARINSEKTDF